MASTPPGSSASETVCARLLPVALIGWLAVAWSNLYFFAFPSMDSWCYSGPAIMAKAPLRLATPFVGTFLGDDKGWGLHWPGGPLLTSLFMPFLPHIPAVFVSVYLGYWMLAAIATMALVRRLTGSPWLALCGFLLVVGDRVSFSITWLERYEMLSGAIAIATLLALCAPADRRPGLRAAMVAFGFFAMPLLHPVFSGLALAWLVLLGFRTWALGRSYRHFVIAAVSYGAGWAAFAAYYLTRPLLYMQFHNHAYQNLILTKNAPVHGIRKFLANLMEVGAPTHASSAIYLVAMGGTLALLFALWKSRAQWRDFLLGNDLALFAALGFAVTLGLAQMTYNGYYWSCPWPFAAALACDAAARLAKHFPRYARPIMTALALLVLLQASFLPARTFLWYRNGFRNMRSELRNFASSLPRAGKIFIPESLWETYAGRNQPVMMNALPYTAGDAMQKSYADFIRPMLHRGDVLVVDQLQSHATQIDFHHAGWKEIGACKMVYSGAGAQAHGYDLTAYVKQ
ncbi:MAG TPA: hypothetical protein VHY22_15875 [Chthoniobacteraceae bacterium]|jgi:hypothetical protein|nr:hypothetical protein [Chthoniobacteraceae bacterium]